MLENLLNLEPGSPLNPAILSLFIELRMISKCFESFKSKFSGRKLQIESLTSIKRLILKPASKAPKSTRLPIEEPLQSTRIVGRL